MATALKLLIFTHQVKTAYLPLDPRLRGDDGEKPVRRTREAIRHLVNTLFRDAAEMYFSELGRA